MLLHLYKPQIFFRGNWRGKKPYVPGIPCSSCPLGYGCPRGVCAKESWGLVMQSRQLPGQKGRVIWKINQLLKSLYNTRPWCFFLYFYDHFIELILAYYLQSYNVGFFLFCNPVWYTCTFAFDVRDWRMLLIKQINAIYET